MRVRCASAKFRELSGLITHSKVLLKLKGKFYTACIGSVMIYGKETWALFVDHMARFDRTEMRTVR